MDVEEAGVLDCFVAAGSELQRTQMATLLALQFLLASLYPHPGDESKSQLFYEGRCLRRSGCSLREPALPTGNLARGFLKRTPDGSAPSSPTSTTTPRATCSFPTSPARRA